MIKWCNQGSNARDILECGEKFLKMLLPVPKFLLYPICSFWGEGGGISIKSPLFRNLFLNLKFCNFLLGRGHLRQTLYGLGTYFKFSRWNPPFWKLEKEMFTVTTQLYRRNNASFCSEVLITVCAIRVIQILFHTNKITNER